MRSYDELFDLAAARKGGAAAMETAFAPVKSPAQLAKIGDDRYLSRFSQTVFSAGFNWQVVENKWPRFEELFGGFAVGPLTLMSDEDLDRYLKDEGIIRHATKILSIRDNAIFLSDLAQDHGSAAKCFANWPSEDFVGLLGLLKKRGSRLGGNSGGYSLRFMGVDSFILSRDVIAALIREGVIDKAPTSKSALQAVQTAFNEWRAESGRSLTHISQTLAWGVGA